MSAQSGPAARFALRFFENRHLLVLSIITIILAGFSVLSAMPRIEDPRITNRFPRVVTFFPGASAEQVEALVTDPIEDSIRELSEVKEIRSTSRAGVSVLVMELEDYIGPGENEQVFSKMRDRLGDVVDQLPAGVSAPTFDDKNSAVAFSLIVSITPGDGGEPSLGLLNRLAGDVADRLRGLSGTDNVRLFGSPQEEISVTLQQYEASSLGLDAATVANAIASADTRRPAGAVRGADRDLFLEVDGELATVERIRSVPLSVGRNGATVALGDLAEVRKSWRDPPFDIAYANGERGVLIAAQTRRDIRLDQWAERARELIETFASEIGAGVDVAVVFDQSVYTEERLSSLTGNLLAGAVLVTLVVFIGMGWRAAAIVGSALPLSAALALFGLSAFGQQIHQMSIFGLIIAIGLLIDNAIVMTDEVKKRLDVGAERRVAVTGALSHLFVPLLASTLTTVLGFMPVFLLPGAMGDFVGPIAISVVLALTASFFISMTIIPSLSGMFLRRNESNERAAWWVDGIASERLALRYKSFLRAAISRPLVTAAACLFLPISGFILAGTLGQQFFPPADRDQFEIEVWLPPDASIRRTEAVAKAIEVELREYDAVSEVHWLIGRSYPTIYYNRIMRFDGNNSYAHAMVYTADVDGAKQLTTQLPAELSDQFPDARIVVSPFAQGPPVDAPVGFRIEGPNVAELKQLGDELRRIMHSVPGIVATRASVTGGLPRLHFDLDEVAARQTGLSLADVASRMQAGLEGSARASLFEDVEELPVRVRIEPSDRDSTPAVASMALRQSDNGWLPVTSLGAVSLEPEVSSISRLDGVRSNDVLGYIARDALAIDVTNAVLRRIEAEGFSVPPGYRFVVAGDSAEQSDALGSLTTYLPVLLMLMVTTIVLSFRSVRLASLIGVVAILSVGLGMLSLWIGGHARGFNAIIGSVGLVGVAINGTIVVLAALREKRDAIDGNVEAIVRETVGASRHIFSTTATTVGGFIPLLLLSGGDFWPPLAIVIAGGVLFSVTLSLVFTPAVFCWLAQRKQRRAQNDTQISIEPEGAIS